MGYSISDAIKDLTPIFDKAPPQAQRGKWKAIVSQANVSSLSGSYIGADGFHVSTEFGDRYDRFDDIEKVVEKLVASSQEHFNTVLIEWTKSKLFFVPGSLSLETLFNEKIVPRGPKDPIYEDVAAKRLAYWRTRGAVADGFAAQRGEANVHNQTAWFGPHHRVLSITIGSQIMLATDGLSTPWAGVCNEENGVECELYLTFEKDSLDAQQIDDWAHLLISIGDMVADGYRVANDVAEFEAIIFCQLEDDFLPMTRMILSVDPGTMDDMPFGPVPLIKAIPIREEELEGLDLSDEWSATAAKAILAARAQA